MMPILGGGKPKIRGGGGDLSIQKRKTKSREVFDGITVNKQTPGGKSREVLSLPVL